MSGRVVEQKHKHILAQGPGNGVRQSRSVEEDRRDLSRLGVEPVHDVTRVIIERAGNEILTISQPDVFKSPNSERYTIFGEAKSEESSTQPETGNDYCDIEFLMTVAKVSWSKAIKALKDIDGETGIDIMDLLYLSEEEEIVDEETGFYVDDIELVMTKAGVSRSKAVKALMANGGNVFVALAMLVLFDKEEDIDEIGVDHRDIELVMRYAGVSRSEAVKALKSYDGDIVAAILDLTDK